MAAPAYINPSPLNAVKKMVSWIVGAFIGLIVLIILVNLFSFFTVIGPGERGILIQWGNIKSIYEPGLHFQLPIINSVEKIDIQTQKSQADVSAASKDLQAIHTIVALNYHVDAAKVDSLYRQIGVEYEERIISPTLQESVKATTAQFTAEELITKRQEVKENIKAKLIERLNSSFIDVDDFSIVDFNFSDEFNRAIESKQTAVQTALKAENDLRRIEIEAKQKIETAKAEAESIRIQGEALKENQGLVQLKAVEKWNGVLPTYVLSGAIPFISVPTK